VPASTQSNSRALRRAIARRKKRERRGPSETLEGGLDDASEVESKIDRIVSLYTEIASGNLDVKSVSDEIDALVGLLQRLDHAGRWKEALRVARCLSLLLALIGRWMELLNSLRIALHASEQLGDAIGEAWASHELGTLHLAAGKHAEADRQLSRAREIRERCGDRPGLAATNRNLQVLCQTLRRLLHRGSFEQAFGPLVRRPALAVIVAGALLAAGGTAGAVIAHSRAGDSAGFHPATVAFSSLPSSPHAGQSIVFSATAADPQDPVASYTWQWGDGDPATERVQTHVYREVGKYTVVLTVRDAGRRITGQVTRSVIVKRPPVAGPNADFSFQPRSPVVGRTVLFDARYSFDPGASIANYVWHFGDGQGARGVTATHPYTGAQAYKVSLTITDTQGRQSTLVQMIAVTARPGRRQAYLHLRCPSSSVLLGEAVTASGSTTPPRPSETISVIYVSPTHREITETPTSDAQGFYQASVTPEEAGQWSIQSSLRGDSDYLPSTSETCTFSVEKPNADGQSEEKVREEKEREERLAKEKQAEEKQIEEARLREQQGA
jgi:PKD repeat protein